MINADQRSHFSVIECELLSHSWAFSIFKILVVIGRCGLDVSLWCHLIPFTQRDCLRSKIDPFVKGAKLVLGRTHDAL